MLRGRSHLGFCPLAWQNTTTVETAIRRFDVIDVVIKICALQSGLNDFGDVFWNGFESLKITAWGCCQNGHYVDSLDYALFNSIHLQIQFEGVKLPVPVKANKHSILRVVTFQQSKSRIHKHHNLPIKKKKKKLHTPKSKGEHVLLKYFQTEKWLGNVFEETGPLLVIYWGVQPVSGKGITRD